MKYFAGIDIGSTAIKTALADESGLLVGWYCAPTGSSFHKNSVEALNTLLEKNGITRDDVAYLVSTGYGRKLFKDADESISEITANARGAKGLGDKHGKVRTILNIGGQDSKVIALDDDGHVKTSVMNDKCAAGTGRFLEVAARNLEVDIEELGVLHFEAGDAPLPVNSTCTVFAESEIISLLSHGHGKGEIIAGIHYSIAKRIVRLASRVNIEDVVFFDGGPAMNKGMVAALEDELMRPVVVPEVPQITTAFGAALIARELHAAA
ncbi:MAG: acyl-CoA dehydratase activase [Nitrospirota bacterium]|nr:acyl-CoA dehydratase activase [Nitrospirota bacterium]